MAKIFDRLAKEVLIEGLGPACLQLESEREVVTNPQSLDLWCVPDTTKLDLLAPYGLLRRMAEQGPMALEFFHQAPSLDDALGCLQKALVARRPAELPPREEEPWLWLICGGRPTRALAALGHKRERGWPPGVYSGATGFRMRVIVSGELPETEDTLLLRALGAGNTLRQAQRELQRRGLSDPIAALVLPIMVKLHFEGLDAANDPETREFLMNTHEFYEAWLRRAVDEGRREEAVKALLAVLAERGRSVSEDQLVLIRNCHDLKRLEVWHRRAISAATTDEVLK